MDVLARKPLGDVTKYHYTEKKYIDKSELSGALSDAFTDIFSNDSPEHDRPASHRPAYHKLVYRRQAQRRLFGRFTVVRWRLVLAFRHLLRRFYYLVKWLVDITVIMLSLPMVVPLALITALAIRLDSPGPVVFRQIRIGRGGNPFTCYKFRSMTTNAEQSKTDLLSRNEADGPIFKIQDDPRVTRVGRFIRRTSIDELPQLLNVLKGEMSLVGPRPPLPNEVRQYRLHHLGRLDAIPGLTGLQQVSGRSNLDFERWVALDLQYIDQQSLWGDVKIMLKTIPVVLLRRGAY